MDHSEFDYCLNVLKGLAKWSELWCLAGQSTTDSPLAPLAALASLQLCLLLIKMKLNILKHWTTNGHTQMCPCHKKFVCASSSYPYSIPCPHAGAQLSVCMWPVSPPEYSRHGDRTGSSAQPVYCDVVTCCCCYWPHQSGKKQQPCRTEPGFPQNQSQCPDSHQSHHQSIHHSLISALQPLHSSHCFSWVWTVSSLCCLMNLETMENTNWGLLT